MNSSNATDEAVCVYAQEVENWYEVVDEMPAKVAITLAYVACLTLGALGNMAVLWCVAKKRADVKFKVRAVFVASLAVSNLILLVTAPPMTATTALLRRWVFGRALCRLAGLLQASSVFFTSFVLIAIAMDRYFVITRPAQSLTSQRKAIATLVAAWVAAIVFATPLVPISRLSKDFERLCAYSCVEVWPSEALRRSYVGAAFVVQYLLPVVAISYCYIRLNFRVVHQGQLRLQYSGLSQNSAKNVARRVKAVKRMTCLMTFSFIGFWAPLNVSIFLKEFNLTGGRFETLIHAVCHIVAMFSTAVNPILYSWFDKNFREVVSRLVSCLVCRRVGRDRRPTETEMIFLRKVTPLPSFEPGSPRKQPNGSM